ncbi:MAG: hypothetical protein GPOALKHO_001830 [Sodalis sp.]|uniref:hypothetical protein n=1 Tax=Sodalis sp. (in: enterobacteria) TaxID=1898979 RepID=UPI003873598E|nr:MAG: hypothetical protein GPOALKHO_001830 [Sodalis sp.]
MSYFRLQQQRLDRQLTVMGDWSCCVVGRLPPADPVGSGSVDPLSDTQGILFLAPRWLLRQMQPQELQETRSRHIITAGARMWARSRVDILICAFAAHGVRTWLTNRLSFDSQLALQLEEHQDVIAHGVVVLIMRPDPERLGSAHAAAIDGALINLLSVSVKRYPDTLLAHYFATISSPTASGMVLMP